MDKPHDKYANDKEPNYRDSTGGLFLFRCFVCGGSNGKENWLPMVASGRCAWCGWQENPPAKTEVK